jgi:hypothetical protein
VKKGVECLYGGGHVVWGGMNLDIPLQDGLHQLAFASQDGAEHGRMRAGDHIFWRRLRPLRADDAPRGGVFEKKVASVHDDSECEPGEVLLNALVVAWAALGDEM